MKVPPSPDQAEDQLLERFGYRQGFARTLRSFESFALGAVVYALMWALEPYAMRNEPGAHGLDALEVADQPPAVAPIPAHTGR